MSFSDVYQIAGSAMTAQTTRLNTIASNLANANSGSTTEAETYRARKPVFATVYEQHQQSLFGSQQSFSAGARVQVLDVVNTDGQLDKRYEPGNPIADADGYVFYPNVDVVHEMADMMSASRSFETNVDVLSRTRSMQQGLLKLGQ
ncbi:flagellar basal body rod protein FlgC [Vibrio astriarenae]|jgi:flagellar basal-body rod protein FlgC|uniref:Flagellar basal-body rod protein FlgC n=1 Tax=Vibrio agarivorans TaxID=153622 RepID=A0ABT7XVV0_9VIBR|nr:flagellar basal body rod protein FlgC [Vibrio agarivorans]MDN2479901.1 flagellar basal body rod protein FlgC [Vibrio agarivorans]MDN3662100.1 flagellar basal body rod protein FlgC [Vibrio agarivorans]